MLFYNKPSEYIGLHSTPLFSGGVTERTWTPTSSTPSSYGTAGTAASHAPLKVHFGAGHKAIHPENSLIIRPATAVVLRPNTASVVR